MTIDGANQGVMGEDAMKAILCGEQPKVKLTRKQMLENILAMKEYTDCKTYNDGCLWLAKQFYLIRKDGIDGDASELYKEMKKRCGEKNYDFTGFMVGWANNCSRWLVDLPEQENPALITIGVDEEFKRKLEGKDGN